MKIIPCFLLIPLLIHAGELTVFSISDISQEVGHTPLRITFSEPMIPLGYHTYAVPTGLSIVPEIPGRWSWESQSTLIFTPNTSWCSGNRYTVTVPAGVASKISKKRLKRPFVQQVAVGSFSGSIMNPSALRSAVDFVDLAFSLDVNPDSLCKYLSGMPSPLGITTIRSNYYRIRPQSGWPTGHRITLKVGAGLTPVNGTMPLDSKITTSFFVSDSLICQGLFRNNVKVSPSDTLFLEDDYELKFNRPLHADAFRDYLLVNGKRSDSLEAVDNRIAVTSLIVAGQPCTLTLKAGMPSQDSAFLFKNKRFILRGDSGRIDPALKPFTIKNAVAIYSPKDSIMPLSLERPVELKQFLRFHFVVDEDCPIIREPISGQIHCLTSEGPVSLDVSTSRKWFVDPWNIPAHANCTLVVKAGYRLGDCQLKKDFVAVFRTGERVFNDICLPMIVRASFVMLPGSTTYPLVRYGSSAIISGVRPVYINEALLPWDTTGQLSRSMHRDTIPAPASRTDWNEYFPIDLAPGLSSQGLGIAEVLLLTSEGVISTRDRCQVSDLGLQLMRGRLVTAATVTSLTKRTPVADAKITFYGSDRAILANGTTDSAGLFRIPRSIAPKFVTAAIAGDTLVYETAWLHEDTQSDTLVCNGAIFTDRPIYRPGDTLLFKGVVRRLLDRWGPAPRDSAIVQVDWEGAKPYIDTLPLIGCGSFSGAIAIPADVANRPYDIAATLLHARHSVQTEFSVSEFRTAELSCRVEKGSVNGDSVRFVVSANWLHGGAASKCPVSWTCWIDRNAQESDWGDYQWREPNRDYATTILSDTSQLDTSGHTAITVARLVDDSGAVYALSAVVTGSPMQSARARRKTMIPPSNRICIGFPLSTNLIEGDTAPVLLKAVHQTGECAKDTKLQADFIRHVIVKKNAKNRCGLPAVIVETIDSMEQVQMPVTDSLGIFSLRMALFPAGEYTVVIAPPNANRSASFAHHFTIEAPDTNGLPSDYDEKESFTDRTNGFTIAAIDSAGIAVGDTVRIRITAPKDSCRVQLTTSRENLYEYRWIVMTGRDTVVRLGIRDEYIPNVKVRATFLPPLLRNSQGFAFQQPNAIKTVFTTLNVSAESRRIAVNVLTNHSDYAPGDTVTVHVNVPRKFATATALVMAVDEGILRLSDRMPADIHKEFFNDYFGRDDFVTESSLQRLYGLFDYDRFNALKVRPDFRFGHGWGGGFGDGTGSVDDLIGSLMGGDEGGSLTLGLSIFRQPPRPCAYFNPQVVFDATGKATCHFVLPGNLTRWRITVIVDDTASFGMDTTSFTASKPLMIRPQLPRFLRMGDSASALYLVENGSEKTRTVTAGAVVDGDTTISTFTLSKAGTQQCRLPLTGRTTGIDSLLFFAQSDSLGDGIRVALPTLFERPRNVAAVGGSTIDSVRIPLVLPNPTAIDSGSLTMQLATTRMQNLREGVRYLFDYPYGCLEQLSSRVMPLLMLSDFTERFHLPMLAKGDEKMVIQKYLDHIKDFQNDSSGGLGYWPTRSGSSSPWLTAFVIETMLRAKANGYTVNDSVSIRALDYLKREMQRPDSTHKKVYTDSYFLLVAAQAGKPDRTAMRSLYRKSDSVSVSARINLLKAMHHAGGFKREVATLQWGLTASLVEKDRLAYFNPRESQEFECFHESPVRQTALALEALLATGARSRFDEPMVRWLTDQQRYGRWRSTQENLAVFRAFDAYTRVYEKELPKLTALVKLCGSDWLNTRLNGREGAFAEISRALDSIPVSGDTSVTVKRTGAGRLYYDILLTTIPHQPAPSQSSGLAITRTLTSTGTNQNIDPSRLKVGELMKVELTIQCNQDITFAAINDPIPAGCEAIVPDLNTGEQTIAREVTGWSGRAELSHREFRDSRVLLFADNLPAGEYRFSYLLKPTTPGRFLWPAPIAEAMYFPEIFGRGAESTVVIAPAE
jgi:uncharacterized protein YfaS (alpha-2-macroglobulin family)